MIDMQYTVIRAFFDKENDKQFCSVGDYFESSSSERVAHLLELGYIKHSDAENEIVSLGGGYFRLPNGERVRGREKALESLAELQSGGKS